MVMAISKARAKQQRAPAGVASGSTTSKPSSSNDSADSEAITVGPATGRAPLTGKTKHAKQNPSGITSGWEMTPEEALRVNFVEFEI